MKQVILASGSPRRQELLRLVVENYEVCVSDADESLPDNIEPSKAVELLAARKAQSVADSHKDALVIGADTVVVLDSKILGKPTSNSHAKEMLQSLSGRVHQVYTGVALCEKGTTRTFSCCTDVEFASLNEDEIDWYLTTDEPFDKAGGYGIQQYGARFVKGIKGDYFNVMGLPVHELYTILGRVNR